MPRNMQQSLRARSTCWRSFTVTGLLIGVVSLSHSISCQPSAQVRSFPGPSAAEVLKERLLRAPSEATVTSLAQLWQAPASSSNLALLEGTWQLHMPEAGRRQSKRVDIAGLLLDLYSSSFGKALGMEVDSAPTVHIASNGSVTTRTGLRWGSNQDEVRLEGKVEAVGRGTFLFSPMVAHSSALPQLRLPEQFPLQPERRLHVAYADEELLVLRDRQQGVSDIFWKQEATKAEQQRSGHSEEDANDRQGEEEIRLEEAEDMVAGPDEALDSAGEEDEPTVKELEEGLLEAVEDLRRELGDLRVAKDDLVMLIKREVDLHLASFEEAEARAQRRLEAAGKIVEERMEGEFKKKANDFGQTVLRLVQADTKQRHERYNEEIEAKVRSLRGAVSRQELEERLEALKQSIKPKRRFGWQ